MNISTGPNGQAVANGFPLEKLADDIDAQDHGVTSRAVAILEEPFATKLADHAAFINGHIDKMLRADASFSLHRLRAAQGLVAAKQIVEPGKWLQWCKENIRPVRSRQDIARLIKIAASSDPQAALDAERVVRREGMARSRAKDGTHVGSIAGSDAKVSGVTKTVRKRRDGGDTTTIIDTSEYDGAEGNFTDPTIRTNGFMFRAAESLRYAKYDDMADLEVSEEMWKAGWAASTAWEEVVRAYQPEWSKRDSAEMAHLETPAERTAFMKARGDFDQPFAEQWKHGAAQAQVDPVDAIDLDALSIEQLSELSNRICTALNDKRDAERRAA
jgi:hypothetical protein